MGEDMERHLQDASLDTAEWAMCDIFSPSKRSHHQRGESDLIIQPRRHPFWNEKSVPEHMRLPRTALTHWKRRHGCADEGHTKFTNSGCHLLFGPFAEIFSSLLPSFVTVMICWAFAWRRRAQ